MTNKCFPICQRNIEPANKKEVDSGEHVGYIYAHDDVPHSDDDIEELENGIN